MSKHTPIRCSECGGTSGPFTTYVNAATAETHFVCNRCSAEGSAADITDLAELDERLSETEENLLKMEPMLKKADEKNDLPEGLALFAQTPMTLYKSMQMYVAALKTRRIEILSSTRSSEKIQYELDKMLSEENYEAASLLKKELDQVQVNPSKKKPKKEEKSKVLFQKTDETAGKCINCKTNHPKAPGLFHNLDFPNLHDMCVSCIAQKIPSIVRTVKTADYMIEQMKRFSKFSDGLSSLGLLMQMRSDPDADFEAFKNAPKSKSSSHKFNQDFIKALESQREYLLLIKEDPNDIDELVNLQNLFNQLPEKDKDLVEILGKVLREAFEEIPKKKKTGKGKPKSEPKNKKK
jgi:hypothetical protein